MILPSRIFAASLLAVVMLLPACVTPSPMPQALEQARGLRWSARFMPFDLMPRWMQARMRALQDAHGQCQTLDRMHTWTPPAIPPIPIPNSYDTIAAEFIDRVISQATQCR